MFRCGVLRVVGWVWVRIFWQKMPEEMQSNEPKVHGERGRIRTCDPCLKRAFDRYYSLYVSMTYSTPEAQKDALLAIVGRNLDANFYVFRSLAIEN